MILFFSYNEDAGGSPEPDSLSTDSTCASPALDVLPSTLSQVCPAEDCRVWDEGLAEDQLPNDLQALKREKLKLHDEVLRLQHEY